MRLAFFFKVRSCAFTIRTRIPRMESPSATAIPSTGQPASVHRGIPRFSVIIPLEFHRGQGEECLRGWTQWQDFRRAGFEIVLAIPPSLPKSEVASMRAMLGPHDQAIDLPHEHDIALCAAAAKQARGEFLFFTESHCHPEPDVLTQAELAFQEHPEWAGFSCESVPITHNLLSQVEAALYGRDIRAAMQHPWRKVLDQCFVVRRDAYLATGGFDPETGHFGEWLLSARFQQRGMKLGYWPRARVRHFYIGELPEWREFTEDFAEGEMRFMTKATSDPAADLFDEAPVWSARFALDRRRARCMAKMLFRDLRARMSSQPSSDDPLQAEQQGSTAWHWRSWFIWLSRAVLGGSSQSLACHARVWWSYAKLHWCLWRIDAASSGAALGRLCTALARLSGNRFLRQWRARSEEASASASLPVENGTWIPKKFSELVQVGFHPHETFQGQPLRWSEPAGMVELPLPEGRYDIKLACMDRGSALDIRFYVNEKPVPAQKVTVRKTSITVKVRTRGPGPVRLGWVCNPHTSQDDPRALGVAVRRVTWTRRA
jgi:hypothetical protein